MTVYSIVARNDMKFLRVVARIWADLPCLHRDEIRETLQQMSPHSVDVQWFSPMPAYETSLQKVRVVRPWQGCSSIGQTESVES